MAKKNVQTSTTSPPIDYSQWINHYNVDRLQLLAVNPTHIYAYWSISNRKKWLCAQHFERDWSIMPKLLRIYNTTDLFFNGTNANHYFDIAVGETDSWHIHHLNPDSTYVADFGTTNMFNQFIPIMRSHAVKMPRNAVVSHGAPIVGTVVDVHAPQHSERIRSAFFENFATLNTYNTKGSV